MGEQHDGNTERERPDRDTERQPLHLDRQAAQLVVPSLLRLVLSVDKPRGGGLDGAQPGYIMEAAPAVGDNYCQENAPGVAEDAGQVLSTTASRSVPFGTFTGNILQTKDYSLIEPHSEHKFYAPGVGMLEAVALNGGSEDLQLYTLQHNQ